MISKSCRRLNRRGTWPDRFEIGGGCGQWVCWLLHLTLRVMVLSNESDYGVSHCTQNCVYPLSSLFLVVLAFKTSKKNVS